MDTQIAMLPKDARHILSEEEGRLLGKMHASLTMRSLARFNGDRELYAQEVAKFDALQAKLEGRT